LISNFVTEFPSPAAWRQHQAVVRLSHTRIETADESRGPPHDRRIDPPTLGDDLRVA
jgi:hypothetical protein